MLLPLVIAQKMQTISMAKRLDNLEIVDRPPPELDKIYFGAWVRLEDEAGEISELRIVGVDEFDLKKRWISIDSPVAKTLLGKSKGMDVLLKRPIGDQEMYISEVSYDGFGKFSLPNPNDITAHPHSHPREL